MSKNEEFYFMGKKIDFESVIPVFLLVENFEAPVAWENGESWINLLGMIFKEGEEYSTVFRLKFPSGNKQSVSTKPGNGHKTLEEAKKDLLKIKDILISELDVSIVEQHKHDLPKHVQNDAVGFMAFLRASNLFNIGTQMREE